MAFRENESQQTSLFDHERWLTAREKRVLEKSWAKVFADEIFPAIDESRFRVLYSEKASRPNTPVNIIVGALIIKEMFDLSDDEMVENLMLDIHFQYALHTTSFEEQPLSDKTLSRFRKRCYEYEKKTGTDLFHDCICDLNNKIAKMMGINSHIKRMDSLMIEANIKKLSRIELLYRCVSNLVNYLNKNHKNIDLGQLKHYCDPDDCNFVIYHSRNVDVNERMIVILEEADLLLSLCNEEISKSEAYAMLIRCLSEQTVTENGKRRLRIKGLESPSPRSLQNPSDPDATFRSKAGRKHIGYIANIVETVDVGGSVVTDYQYEENTYSDVHFLKDYIDKTALSADQTIIVADGGYAGQANKDAAMHKNIKVINTALMGTAVPDIYAEFIVDEAGSKVIKCANGFEPVKYNYFEGLNRIRAYFQTEDCQSCQHKNECNPLFRKKHARVTITRSAVERAKQQKEMATEEFYNWHRIRNGVESIPSILRNQFNIDRMPVRGKIPTKFYFGSKISALNFRKLFRYRKGLICHPYNPILAVQRS